MAYNDVVQAIADAIQDAQTLEDVINGAPDTQYKSRLGRMLWTLATINSKVDYVRVQADSAVAQINAARDNVQQALDSKLADLDNAINTAYQAGAGAKGWAADLIVDGDKTQSQINAYVADQLKHRVSANDYGASTTATDYQVNRAAIQAANDAVKAMGGGVVTLKPGTYIVKGIVQDSNVIFDLKGVTLKSPDGDAPDVIRTRTTAINVNIIKDSNNVVVTSGDISSIKIGTRISIIAAGGILDSQVTTLASAIDATTTTITLTNAIGLTPLAPVIIGNELISFTGVTGNSLTGVTRGAFGTTASSHTTTEQIGVARALMATVIKISGNTLTLDKKSSFTATAIAAKYGIIGGGIIGYPTIDGSKISTGSSSAVYGFLGITASSCVFDMRLVNCDIGGFMLSDGSAYNYGHRIHLHDCGLPDAGKGSAFWLYQGCEHNHFNHIEVTGEAHVAVYLDDRTSTSDPNNAPNCDNTFVTTNINVTKSVTAVINIVSGQYNKFLNGSIVAPRVGISIDNNSQGVGGGAKSVGNVIDKFDIDVDEYPYLVYASGNTLANINVKRGRLAPIVAAGNLLYAISPASGVAPIIQKGYRKNSNPLTRLVDWTGYTIPAAAGTGSANGVIDVSATATTYNPIVYNEALVPASANETYTAALDIEVPTGYPSIQVRLALIAYRIDNGTSYVALQTATSATTTINAGEIKRLQAVMFATPTDTTGLRLQVQMMSAAASGRRIVVKPKITVEKDVINVVSLFDGDTSGGMWTGTTGQSPSILF